MSMQQETVTYVYLITSIDQGDPDDPRCYGFGGRYINDTSAWYKFKNLTDITNSLRIGFLYPDELYEDEIPPSEIGSIDIYTSDCDITKVEECELFDYNNYDTFDDIMTDVEEKMKPNKRCHIYLNGYNWPAWRRTPP